MSVCTVCSKTAEKARNKVLCSSCASVCHANCVNLSKDDVDFLVAEKQVWRCPKCTADRRKSMSELKSVADDGNTITQIVTMLEEASADRKRIEAEISKAFDFVHAKVDEQSAALKVQNDKLTEYLLAIESLQKENAGLKRRVVELEARVDDEEQYMRSNTMEIQGIPEVKSEDVYELVKKVGVALDVPVSDQDIDVCHRLGKKPGSDRPAGIVVKFVRRVVKQRLMEKRRVKRNLNTQDLGFNQPAVPVYLNDSLTSARRKLYAAARAVKREKDFTYLWVRNGKIFLRKNQGDPVIVVSSIEQIEKIA